MTEVSPFFEPRGRDHDELMENSEVGIKFEVRRMLVKDKYQHIVKG